MFLRRGNKSDGFITMFCRSGNKQFSKSFRICFTADSFFSNELRLNSKTCSIKITSILAANCFTIFRATKSSKPEFSEINTFYGFEFYECFSNWSMDPELDHGLDHDLKISHDAVWLNNLKKDPPYYFFGHMVHLGVVILTIYK